MSRALDTLSSLLGRIDRLCRSHWFVLLTCELVGLSLILSRLRSTPADDGAGQQATASERPETEHTAPRVSVLMPAWNEESAVEASIRGFLSVAYPAAELVLCAGGSDSTYETAAEHAAAEAAITVVEQTDAMNKQAALNRCLEEATGEIYFLVDGDCVLDTEIWYATLLPILRGAEDVVTGGSRPTDGLWERWLPTYQYVKEEYERARRPPYADGLLGRNAALTRAAMDELGSFNESIDAGTDYNLAKRLLEAGYDIRFVAESKIQSDYPTTVSEYLAQQSRWVRNVFFLGREWDATDEVRASLTTCFVGVTMLVLPIVGLVFVPLLFGWVALVVYGLWQRYDWVAEFNETHDEQVSVAWFCLVSGLLMFVEFVAWAYTAAEIVIPSRRRRW